MHVAEPSRNTRPVKNFAEVPPTGRLRPISLACAGLPAGGQLITPSQNAAALEESIAALTTRENLDPGRRYRQPACWQVDIVGSESGDFIVTHHDGQHKAPKLSHAQEE